MIKKVRTKNLKGLIEEHRKEKVIYRTYEFDNDSYMALLCDINSLLHQLEEKDKVIDEVIKFIKKYQRKDEFLNLNEWQSRELREILERGKR